MLVNRMTVFALVPFLVASLAGVVAAEEISRGGTVVIGLNADGAQFNPALRASTSVLYVTGKILEPLVDKGPGGYEPVLATKWTAAEDGKTVTFNLREGVNWHDGRPFTCADVSYTAMTFWKLRLNYSTTLQANLEAVDCPDLYTAVFRYSKPMPINLLLAALPDLGYPLPKHLYEGTDVATNPYNLKPVGTGPFKFSEYEKGQYIIATRNDDYWRGKEYPYLDQIVWKVITDPAAAAAALEAGEVDEVGFNGTSSEDAQRLGKDGRFDVGTQGYENNVAHSTVEFNFRNPALAKIEVRRAIYHALDIDFAIKSIMHGFAKPGRGPIPSTGGLNYTDDVQTYAYDPALAERMLDEAGFKRGADGVRFKIKHRAAPFGEYTNLWAAYYKQALKQVGIEVELVTNDFPGWVTAVYRDHDFDTASGFHQFRSDPAVSTTVWLRTGAPAGAAWTNQYDYKSDKMDELIDTAQTELDVQKRAELYHQVQALEMQDLPVIFAIEHPFLSITSRQLRNHHNMPRWNSSSWYDLWKKQ